MKEKTFVVHVNNIFDKFTIEVKPLGVDALNRLIALSMESGFYGNLQIIKYIGTMHLTKQPFGCNIVAYFSQKGKSLHGLSADSLFN